MKRIEKCLCVLLAVLLCGAWFGGAKASETEETRWVYEESTARQTAVDTVSRFFGPEIAADIQANVDVFFQEGEKSRAWCFRMSSAGYDNEFVITVDAVQNYVTELDWSTPQGAWADPDAWWTLTEEAMGLSYGQWSIYDKWLYDKMQENFPLQYAVPSADEISDEAALEIARNALLAACPELTKESLDAATVCPYMYDSDAWLFETVYPMRIYYFDFDLDGNDETADGYAVILDAKTGECLLIADPSNSANG